MNPKISIILPTYNEKHEILATLIAQIEALKMPELEIVIVDDGSRPPIAPLPAQQEIRLIRHPHNLGNGAAVKTGARNAKAEILVFMDADGQHHPEDIPSLLSKLNQGYDMVIGAREVNSQASLNRRFGNGLLNSLASLMTGYKIDDLTSGFRAVYAKKFRKFLYLLPNRFSYPTTITMAFFRSAYPVAYVPIHAGKRTGLSKIKFLKDGLRFFVIILKIGALFSPMRLFLPVSFAFFLVGTLYYSYTYFMYGRFTNMTALLFIASMLTFLIGIVSEQISALHYKGTGDDDDRQG